MQAAARPLACAALSHAAPAASVVRGVNSPDDVLAGAFRRLSRTRRPYAAGARAVAKNGFCQVATLEPSACEPSDATRGALAETHARGIDLREAAAVATGLESPVRAGPGHPPEQ